MSWPLTNTMNLLAFAANAGFLSLHGNSEDDSLAVMKQLDDTELPLVKTYSGETWSLVWGPVVIARFDPLRMQYNLQNTMLVAQQQGTSNYAIGLSGTDLHSVYDDVIEDLDIIPVAWPYAANAGSIEQGAMLALRDLQSMIPYRTHQQGVNLSRYLTTVAAQPATIYVTGHSLGGALAEVVATWLADTRQAWDPKSNATVVPMSFAGPTPGDGRWASHFNDTFQGGAGQRVWNSLDVVPHVWNAGLVAQIKGLYGSVAPPNLLERAAIDATLIEARLHDYAQVLGDGTMKTGTLQTGITSFLDQLWYQHVCAYYAFMGVPPAAWANCPAASRLPAPAR